MLKLFFEGKNNALHCKKIIWKFLWPVVRSPDHNQTGKFPGNKNQSKKVNFREKISLRK